MHSKRHSSSSATRRLEAFRVTRDATSRAVLDFLESLDCPRSLTIALLFRNKEYQQIVDLEFSPSHYLTLSDFRDAYLATAFLSKFEDFPLTVDRDKVAKEKFEKFELSCRSINSTFRRLRAQNWKNSELAALLSAMSFKISCILGDLDCQELFDSCDWGPGASTTISRRHSSHPHKFQFETGITRRLYDLLCPDGSLAILRGYSPRWCQRLIEEGFPFFQSGNKVVTVPKNSRTNRVIAIEPGFNLWIQKGIGSMMKRRLRKWRIDLTDQSRNQNLSHKGSVDGSLATIDFSSASDSISYELVKELFPPLWFELLDRSRSERGKMEEQTRTWEKFSSMGNGYTFEVETLIFFSLALVCADKLKVDPLEISVYGDDVILPVDLYHLFHRYSELLGFSFNTEKSHATSPFRESCGAHWYDGIDIKPVYLKRTLNTVQSVYRLANSIRRLAHRSWYYSSCDARYRTAFYRLVYSVPKSFRFMIPDGFGDGGFISNFDEATPIRASHGIEGYRVRHVVDLSVSTEVEYSGLLLAHLYWISLRDSYPLDKGRDFLKEKMSTQSTGNTLSIRDHTRPVITTGLVPQWYDLGLWL